MRPVLKLMGDGDSRRATDRLERLAKALGDQFVIERPIGAGAVATVYQARSVRHKRTVAIKVLRGELTPTLAADRFLREIEIAAGLAHPHILPLYQSGEADGSFYYVMPYAEEGSLRNRLDREGPFALDQAIRIAVEVADALSAAHKRGVVHRDVKPENILFEEGHAVVADFGIAQAVNVAGGERITETGFAVGTPEYMSPEQACGDDDVDGRSDLYSLGCVMYEMLAGQPPFVGPNARAIWARHMIDPVPPLTTVRPGLPKPLVRAVNRALAKAPADRFPTLAEFASALTAQDAIAESSVKSIAVLPFANMSGSADDEYLSDGISEEIINALTKVEGLNVVSRTSAFAFKGRSLDVREIGEQLNVSSVMEGSVRRVGDQLRITAQLVNVADGYHLWSERYDRDMKDVFAIQDEIAENIARALRVILSEDERRAIARAPTASIKAYELYLRGRQFFHQARKKSLEYARQMFLRAIEVDPEYALAHAGVADCCSLLNMYYPATGGDLTQADEASCPCSARVRTVSTGQQRGGQTRVRDRHHARLQAIRGALLLCPVLFSGGEPRTCGGLVRASCTDPGGLSSSILRSAVVRRDGAPRRGRGRVSTSPRGRPATSRAKSRRSQGRDDVRCVPAPHRTKGGSTRVGEPRCGYRSG